MSQWLIFTCVWWYLQTMLRWRTPLPLRRTTGSLSAIHLANLGSSKVDFFSRSAWIESEKRQNGRDKSFEDRERRMAAATVGTAFMFQFSFGVLTRTQNRNRHKTRILRLFPEPKKTWPEKTRGNFSFVQRKPVEISKQNTNLSWKKCRRGLIDRLFFQANVTVSEALFLCCEFRGEGCWN